MNIAVTGCHGQLGNEMQKIAAANALHQWFFSDIDSLDITDPIAVERYFSEHRIDCCINCAAYTAVDRAEDDVEMAEKVNVHASKVLAETCHSQNALLIHVSTDYVFDGKGTQPYRETDPTGPTSVYGKTKLAGEQAIKDSGCHYCIVRTAWLYSATGKNFVKTMLSLAETHDEINVVCDQHGSPTFAGDLAQGIMALVSHYGKRPVKEVFHFTNDGITSWDVFAKAIFELGGKSCKVNSITTDQYPTRATRPAYSALDTTKIKETLGIRIPFWKDSLERCIKELNSQP
jgi:dTDP-4-dehydrorhamnose reductase